MIRIPRSNYNTHMELDDRSHQRLLALVVIGSGTLQEDIEARLPNCASVV